MPRLFMKTLFPIAALATFVVGSTIAWSHNVSFKRDQAKFSEMSPIEQEGVRIHESVHAEQWRPYADRGLLGVLEGRMALLRNYKAWEVAAYKAEYDFLFNYPTQDLDQATKDILYYRSAFVANNLQYYCSVSDIKAPGC